MAFSDSRRGTACGRRGCTGCTGYELLGVRAGAPGSKALGSRADPRTARFWTGVAGPQAPPPDDPDAEVELVPNRDSRVARFWTGAVTPQAPPPDDPDAEVELVPDRDSRVARFAASKGAGRDALIPYTGGGRRDRAWGGALRRMAVGGVLPSREDEQRLVTVPGRYVPIGFARYVSPVADPADFSYFRLSGWRVAVPRSLPGERVRDLLYRIFYFGPQSAGYVRLGDTLTPAILEMGDRMTISQAATDFEPFPISP